MRTPLRSRSRGTLAAFLAGALVFTVTACSDNNADDDDSAAGSSHEQQEKHPAPDFSLSYDIPERWDPESVALVLESSMIGGGINGRGGAVAGDSLFVGNGLNEVKRSSPSGTELIDVTPLKQESAAQEDFHLETFSREGSDYVALWRKGVAESNDERRLGDESSTDSQIYFSVWDAEGNTVYDGALDGVDQIEHVHAGLITHRGDAIDPLTAAPVEGDAVDGTTHTVVGYGASAAAPLVKKETPKDDDLSRLLNASDVDYGTDDWNASDVLTLPERGRFSFETIMGDYAIFSVQDELFSVEEMAAIDIEDGEIVSRTEDQCSTSTYFDDDNPVLTSANGTKTAYGEYMVDADNAIFSCQKNRRGGFAPYIVLDDGTVYGYGEQSSGDSSREVAASMKIGDDEALSEQGRLPIHVDDQGRGWFADSVNHNNGTDTVVAVVEPAEGGSRS